MSCKEDCAYYVNSYTCDDGDGTIVLGPQYFGCFLFKPKKKEAEKK